MEDNTTDSRPRILIVEDDALNRFNLQERLTKEGYRVDIAANGFVADTKIKSGFHPNLIISDLMMPGMDGIELITRLRQDDNTKSVQVIVMSASTERTRILDTLKYGIAHLLFKPLDYNDVVRKVNALLKNGATAKGP